MLQSSVITGVVHSHQKVRYMNVRANRNCCQEYISQPNESDTTQLEKMMSKSGDRVEHGRGTLWHLILAGLECGPRLFEGLEAVESAGSSSMHQYIDSCSAPVKHAQSLA